ncbi:hypothetical protein ACEVAQ_07945 [Ectopseudomonas khazarica]|uniref:Restriction endonuclease type IV Mrr domain-containing protein n=1 Tax=Ectopseudomonas khazarica TaxID=2502979 RepID=A0ABW7MC13_9GAMM
MSKPGDDLEKIVEIIERSISPGAKIEHNVFLPILTSAEGHTAQCDIVIRNGNPPRETLTLIEVQDRNSKVDINTFRGWLGKIEDVGAQHLICVSRKDFPSSIKEKVSQSGSKIFLITLTELPPERIPLEFIRFIFQYRHLDIKSIRNVRPFVAPGQIEKFGLKPMSHSFDERVWSLDGENMISLLDICRRKIKPENITPVTSGYIEGSNSLLFNLTDNERLFYSHNGKLVRMGLEYEFEWGFEYAEIPMSIASYEQDKHGALAWLFEVTHKSKSGFISVKLPVVKLDNGNFEILDSIINSQFEYAFEIIPANQ